MSSEVHPSSLLVVLSAPSGAGKTTLCGQMLARSPEMVRAVTCTTRQPREGERDGIDYRFLDLPGFMRCVNSDEFLEYAEVHGNHYGTLKSEVLDHLRSGKDVLLSIDVQGAATIRSKAEENPDLKRALVTVFITPPSLKVLEERLLKRGTDSPEVIARRLDGARREVQERFHYDYLIVSASMSEDFGRFQAILDAEKMRSTRANFSSFS